MAKTQHEIEAMDLVNLDALIEEHVVMHRADYPQWPNDGTHNAPRENEAWTLDYACQIRRDKTPADDPNHEWWRITGDTGQSATQQLGGARSAPPGSSGADAQYRRFWEFTEQVAARFPESPMVPEEPETEEPETPEDTLEEEVSLEIKVSKSTGIIEIRGPGIGIAINAARVEVIEVE